MSLRGFIKEALPVSTATRLRSLEHSIRGRGQAGGSKVPFGEIYRSNSWGSPESVSGPGSEILETEEIRALLPTLLGRFNIRSLLDAPCGDFSWMSKVDLGSCDYIGAEVVPELVASNKSKYEQPGRRFILADLRKDRLARSDLILCRDCLIHLSFRDAKAVLRNFRTSGSPLLLLTTDPSVKENRPVSTGGYRALNVRLPPFCLPEPLEIHRDRYPPAQGEILIDPHKHLGLFQLV